MPSRRQFLQTGVAAGTALAVTPVVTAQDQKSQPPSITALTSMKALAKPITVDERRQRIERARQLMVENKLDAVAMCGGTSLVYFSNIRWWLSERFFAMVLPAKGEAFYVCPAFEE